MKKKIIIIIIAIIAIAIGIFVYNTSYEMSEATFEDIKKWNDFLQKNRYLAEVEHLSTDEGALSDILLECCIYSENINKIELTEEEKQSLLVNVDLVGYKVEITEVQRICKELFDYEGIEYNFIETFNEEERYLLFNNDVIYFTMPENVEKIYMLKQYIETEENEKEAIIYEYIVDNNKKELNEMLNSGKIYRKLKKEEKHKFIIEEKDGKIVIKSKE